MWDKVQEASKAAALAAGILYLVGFICITGYLAQFGIVTFDIINARFLIAGFNALLALLLCMFVAHQIILSVRAIDFLSWKTAHDRFLLYLKIIFFPMVVSGFLSTYFNIGSLSKADRPESQQFSPLFSLDPVPWVVSHITVDSMPVVRVLVAYFAYAFVCAFLVLLLVAIIGHVVLGKEGAAEPAAAESPAESTVEAAPKAVGLAKKIAIVAMDATGFSAILAILIISYFSLRAQPVDAGTLTNLKYDNGLTLAWCYGTILISTFALLIFGGNWQEKIPDLFSRQQNVITLAQNAQAVLLPLLALIFWFGAVIFPRIPYAMGGGSPAVFTSTLIARKARVGALTNCLENLASFFSQFGWNSGTRFRCK